MRNAVHVNKVPDYNSSNLPVQIFHRENWDDRGETCLTVMSKHSLESLSNDKATSTRKAKSNWFRLAKRASRFFVHFFAVIARPRRKIPNFAFFGGR